MKSISLTIEEALILDIEISNIISQDLSLKTRFYLEEIISKLTQCLKPFSKVRESLMEKYSIEEDGKKVFKYYKDNQVSEEGKAFDAAIKPIIDEIIEFRYREIPFESIESIKTPQRCKYLFRLTDINIEE